MQEIVGDLWELHSIGEWIAIPTNGVVKINGELVMGAGLAKEAASRFPDLARYLGNAVKMCGNIPIPYRAGHLLSFPTKHHWKNDSDLDLIRESAELATRFLYWNPEVKRIYLPRVGTGCGRLPWDDVKRALEPILDDRFIIVTRR